MHMTISKNTHLSLMTTSRTHLDIDRDLKLTLEKIRASVKKHLSWISIAFPLSKKLVGSTVREPGKTAFKFIFCIGACYITYLLIRGIFAGIEVDNDSNISNLFVNNKDIRLNEGLNLTNGDQAGQFMIDALILGYAVFNLIFRESYNKLAGEVVNFCYKPHLIDMLTKIKRIELKKQLEKEENNDKLDYKLRKYIENVNQLYLHLEKDLKPHGAEPIFYEEIEDVPFEYSENEEVVIDINEEN